jgi:hypothetical protein
MDGYNTIQEKLHQFIRKYYTNELIKGSILFFSFGFLYLFFTLFLEHFLWLKPVARTWLFWFFILVESSLLAFFILAPAVKLFGLRKGISMEIASKIIGNHFPEVKDKLLNILQLKNNEYQSDLVLASINQKAEELQPIPFVKALNFRSNVKYLKYAIVPILIWGVTLGTGNIIKFIESLDRVVNYSTAYVPPALFSFSLKNKNLHVIEGESIVIAVEVKGQVFPSEARIIVDRKEYFLQKDSNNGFSYVISNLQHPIKFYLEANGVKSQEYRIQVLKIPTIHSIFFHLKYPYYLGKKEEIIQNTGDLLIPEGTKITWKVNAAQTEEVVWTQREKRVPFTKTTANNFEFSKRVYNSFSYQISSSNKDLQDYENLQFSLAVLKDEPPKILVQANNEVGFRESTEFAGQVSDDYGLNKLQLVYYDEDTPKDISTVKLPISKANIQTFFYQFPEGLTLKGGTNYEFFFEVYDNDAVNGNKKARSKLFNYRQKTNDEIDEEVLQEQRRTINSLDSSIDKLQRQQEDLDKIQQELQNKNKISWSDKRKVGSFIKRQEQYKKMMQRQTDKLQDNLGVKKEQNNNLQNKKEELKKRIEELKKTDKQQQLLDEIAKLAAKLNKEGLVKKAKELAQQNKQQERSLERILELVKRFYIEQKTMQISNKLKELSLEQEALENNKDGRLENQKEIKKEFELIKNQLEELAKDNEKLKEPMQLPDVESEKRSIDEALTKVEDNLEENVNSVAKKNQMKSAQKMMEMSAKMQEAMMKMEADSVQENIEDLRKILENMVLFSMKQEDVMNKFADIFITHPDYGKYLKEQNDIRKYFEHIDDSLYVLSMRLPKISAKIQEDLSMVHYNLEQSLENFSENRFNLGISNQRYVMTGTNNLADYLSTMLNSMKNASMKMGKGKGKGSGFSLPDIIKKQGELSEKMKSGMKKGEKKGKNSGDKKGKGKSGKMSGDNGKTSGTGKSGNKGSKGNLGNNGSGENGENDDLDGELYKIYKQQSQLRQQLKEAIKESENKNANGMGSAKSVLKSMEQLEEDILKLGFNEKIIQKMQQLNYELLKLDRATLKQGKDNKRKANVNLKDGKENGIRAVEFKMQFYKEIEILNRHSLPLHQNYKRIVRKYFSERKNKEL